MSVFQTIFRTLIKPNKCGTDKLFAYFIGLLGLSGMMYTYLQSHVMNQNSPDILYVDRDTLQIEKGGRYAVLLKRAISRNISHDPHKIVDSSSELNSINNSQSLILSQVNHRDDIDRTNPSEDTYQFVINETDLKSVFRISDRSKYFERCRKLFNGDDSAFVGASLHMSKRKRKSVDHNTYRTMTSNCSKFKSDRGYVDSSVTQVERDFPLAYSIVAYKEAEQIERLLRAIYRPQNFYCVHLDKKTSNDDVITMTAIVDCFPNVFMSSRSIDVRWGEFSVLEAELVCMRDLWSKQGWKYFINLTGQEFPMKTNLEIVKILSALKGANVVDGTWVRARQNYFYRWTKSGKQPPHGIRPIKGSVHVCINRDFVEFALNDYRSKDFLEWLKDTEIPDETFFASLNHNPSLKIPGAFLGEPEEYPQKPTFTRYKNWEIGHGVWARKCSGKYVHNICILGVGDLQRLKNDISLFANKFHLDYQYMAYDCIETVMFQRTRDQYLNKENIDVSFYAMLDQVKLRYIK